MWDNTRLQQRVQLRQGSQHELRSPVHAGSESLDIASQTRQYVSPSPRFHTAPSSAPLRACVLPQALAVAEWIETA
ncbi:hypothetical protein C5C41_05135 [Rathayibacter sp. AY1E9]|nr:hypothetical protein C5C41_05135 [Rathayibacter sp. AY1E9]